MVAFLQKSAGSDSRLGAGAQTRAEAPKDSPLL